MRFKQKNQSKLQKMMVSLFTLMLLLYTAMPYTAAYAAGATTTVTLDSGGIITEERINSGSNIELTLTLNGNEWVDDIITNEQKKQLVIDSMKANVRLRHGKYI